MEVSIILAAGEGTRMKSEVSKPLHTLLNKPMIDYIVEASCEAGVDKNIIIAGEKNRGVLEDNFKTKDMEFRTQKVGEGIPYGTGYAVSLAMDEIKDDDIVLILTSDIPIIQGDTLRGFLDFHKNNKNVATVLTALIDDPTGYGRIIKDEEDNLIKIVEHKDCNKEELLINEFNSGIIVINGLELKDGISRLDTNNTQGELYLTDVFGILREDGKKISTYLIDDVEEVYGINSKLQLSVAEEVLRRRINEKHMINGVILENPSNIFIEKGVKIGKDTRISSGAKIIGNTVIGEGCVITGDTFITNSIIEDEVLIKSSYIEDSHMKKGSNIGPYSHLRPKSVLGEEVHIGNFVEVKNANIGEKTKAGHLAYIGDADLGKDINIGCGAIFVNYDGKNKFRSTIKDGGFIGSNANIVAPVVIEEEGYVAAGSTITKDVEKGALAIERAKQKNIEGWLEKKKKRDWE